MEHSYLKLYLVVMAVVLPGTALGCSCSSQPTWLDAFCSASAKDSKELFFLGTVTSKTVPELARRKPTVYSMNINEVFGGSIEEGGQVQILGDPLCGVGYRLEEGSTYLTQAHPNSNNNGGYTIHLCHDYTSLFDSDYDDSVLSGLRHMSAMPYDYFC